MNERETKELLQLTRENNKLLHKMRRSAMIGNVMRLIYWAAIIGVPIFLYYQFLQPILRDLLDTYSQVQGGVENVGNKVEQIPGLNGLLDLLGIGR
jgi:hypothetical protein